MNRKNARENAFLLLFEMAVKSDETPEEIFDKATAVRELETDDYVKGVFFGVNENLIAIDELIEKSLVGWKAKRLSFVSRAVMRLSVYEMMLLSDIPARVSINEAIELSKKYDDEKAYMLVNGALNACAEALSVK